jgi:uncharacterized protein (DUF983 family)
MTTLDFSPPRRPWPKAVGRGFLCRCPACGEGRLFSGYVTVNKACPQCAEDLQHQRADDAPPYFTIFIVGHTVIPLMLLTEKLWMPPLWLHFALWLPLTLGLSLWLLPRTKGATVGLQWALRMHGFGASAPETRDATHTLSP